MSGRESERLGVKEVHTTPRHVIPPLVLVDRRTGPYYEVSGLDLFFGHGQGRRRRRETKTGSLECGDDNMVFREEKEDHEG